MMATGDRKIAIVGPLAPFSSGIARHTTALAEALMEEEGVEVRAWSFSRQYPALLFPGERQVDPALASPAGLSVECTLDTVWPPSWGRTARRVADWRPDAVIIPAWTFFVAPALAAVARRLRRAGIPVISMVHNASDHEESSLKRAVLARQIRAADLAIAHANAVAEGIAAAAPRLPVSVYPHPLYDTHPAPSHVPQRRADKELLFFGLVRPYKGLDLLLQAMTEVKSKVFLTIAGEIWGGEEALRGRIAELGLEARVELRAGFVPDDEAALLFARCDALVAPYLSATGSGVIALAHFYGKPVIASDLPSLCEVVDHARTGWIIPSGDAAALAETIDSAVNPAAIEAMQAPIAALSAQRSWQGLARLALVCAEKIAADRL